MSNKKTLVELAAQARIYSYSPYSGFSVGAALLSRSGKIYTGCNIESAAYSPTNCAERTAFFKAISEGEREFEAIAIVGGNENWDAFCAPCGVCRQVMAEFCEDDFLILLGKSDGGILEFTLKDLLPMRFGPENLKK